MFIQILQTSENCLMLEYMVSFIRGFLDYNVDEAQIRSTKLELQLCGMASVLKQINTKIQEKQYYVDGCTYDYYLK